MNPASIRYFPLALAIIRWCRAAPFTSSAAAPVQTLFNDVWKSTNGGQTWTNVHKIN